MVGVFSHEGDYACKQVRRSVSQREESDPSYGGRELQDFRQTLEGRTEVSGRSVAKEVEEDEEPEEEAGVAKEWGERAIEEVEIGYVATRLTALVRIHIRAF